MVDRLTDTEIEEAFAQVHGSLRLTAARSKLKAVRRVVAAAERLTDACRSSEFANRRSPADRVTDLVAAVVALRAARKDDHHG